MIRPEATIVPRHLVKRIQHAGGLLTIRRRLIQTG